MKVDRLRVRNKATASVMALPSWEEISGARYLDQWAMNLTMMNMATRKFGRAVPLPKAGVPAAGRSLTRSAVSRRLKALPQARLDDWMAPVPRPSATDLMVTAGRPCMCS